MSGTPVQAAGESAAASAPLRTTRSERWAAVAERISDAYGLVLLLVVACYVLASLTAYSGLTGVLITACVSLTACVALTTAGARTNTVRWAAGLSILAVALALAADLADDGTLLGISAFIDVLLLLAAVGAVLRTVISEPEVGFRTILGAISVYIMLGFLFAYLYIGLDRIQSGPFFGEATEQGDFLFFSITTLSTTGYGNLIPAEQPGKMFAGLEMLLGQIYLVTLIAGLVSLWRPGQMRRKP